MPTQAQSPSSSTLSSDQLETPQGDQRSYAHFVMDNMLEVFVVHDATTNRASAAMDVSVGSFSDDPDMPGMAHAVTHLIHCGSKKYPGENEYVQYLKRHSGSRNGTTDEMSTCCHFELIAGEDLPSPAVASGDEPALHGALDRFAQMFTDPLFLPSAVDRVLQTVDSAFRNNRSDDGRRVWQVEKSQSNPNHPWSRFEDGNLDTLKTSPEARGVNVRDELLKFFRKHYSANRMKLAVEGPEPLRVLKGWILELFAGIVNLEIPENRWDPEGPLRSEDLGTQCFSNLIMDWNWMDLKFRFLNETSMTGFRPSQYFSHLLRHEAPGSILSHLTSRLASRIDTEIYYTGPDSPSIFLWRIYLTIEGLREYVKVVEVFGQYIARLGASKMEDHERVFNELVKVADYDFKFKDKSSGSTFTTQISKRMQSLLPRKWLLSGNMPRTFDAARMEEGLACFRPDNFNVTVASRQSPGLQKRKEKWFGAEYDYEKIPADLLARFEQAFKTPLPELHLPWENKFIPKKLEAVFAEAEPATEPRLIRNDQGVRVWHKEGFQVSGYKKGFQAPRAYIIIHCRNPLAHDTARTFVTTRLFARLVNDVSKEYVYSARLAGFRYSVEGHSTGIKIELSGYVTELHLLLDKLLKTIGGLQVREGFDVVKEKLSSLLENYGSLALRHQAFWLAKWLDRPNWYPHKQMLAELRTIAASDVEDFYPNLFKKMHIEILAGGSICTEDALRLGSKVETAFKPVPLPQAEWPTTATSLAFPPGNSFIYHRKLAHSRFADHCILYCLYTGPRFDSPTRAKTFLLGQMANAPAFDQLRTQEQLGYIVISGAIETATNMSYRILIQSTKAPIDLAGRIDAFLAQFADVLAEMSESDFELHKSSLAGEQLEKLKPKDLKEEASRTWSPISAGHLHFKLEQQDAKAVESLTKDDMVKFYRRHILPSSLFRSKLAIHLEVQSPTETQLEGTIEEWMTSLVLDGKKDRDGEAEISVADFKSTLKIMEAPQPVKDINQFEDGRGS